VGACNVTLEPWQKVVEPLTVTLGVPTVIGKLADPEPWVLQAALEAIVTETV
jgi:hypothetical protein